MNPCGRGSRGEAGGVGRETVIRLYYVKKYFQVKKKIKESTLPEALDSILSTTMRGGSQSSITPVPEDSTVSCGLPWKPGMWYTGIREGKTCT